MAGCPSIDLAPFAEEITDLIVQHCYTQNQVLTWLGEQGVSCRLTTLKKFLRSSNIITAQTVKKSLYSDTVFLAQVKRAYQETPLNDEEAASILRREGFLVTTARQIRSVRENMQQVCEDSMQDIHTLPQAYEFIQQIPHRQFTIPV